MGLDKNIDLIIYRFLHQFYRNRLHKEYHETIEPTLTFNGRFALQVKNSLFGLSFNYRNLSINNLLHTQIHWNYVPIYNWNLSHSQPRKRYTGYKLPENY